MRKIKTVILNLLSLKSSYIDEAGAENKLRPNPKFFEAARKMISMKKNILFIFGDSDRIWWEFEKIFLKEYFSKEDILPFDYYLVPNGNHMLTWVEMQLDCIKKITDWLNEKCRT